MILRILLSVILNVNSGYDLSIHIEIISTSSEACRMLL